MHKSEARRICTADQDRARPAAGRHDAGPLRQSQADDKYAFPDNLRFRAGPASGSLISGQSHMQIAAMSHNMHSGSAARRPRSAPQSAQLQLNLYHVLCTVCVYYVCAMVWCHTEISRHQQNPAEFLIFLSVCLSVCSSVIWLSVFLLAHLHTHLLSSIRFSPSHSFFHSHTHACTPFRSLIHSPTHSVVALH